ncbi:DnaJ domain-containing protein [Hydrogenophaga sp. RWCD_12]|uniref:J domain-containing protein n=1 Tax=Hydrogenophaga sp. RWCD_12 TaxID=3391190 RepID=UPI00398481CF
MTPSAGSVSPEVLWEALLAFQQSPGRHAVARGEPRLLFDKVLDILHLAADRPVSGISRDTPSTPVRQAARFFVRTAMLRSGATHYEVMGVHPGSDLSAVREHYRILIRLTHPDFARDDVRWPDDAAARVNLAHDVLSSSVKRAEYDSQLKARQTLSSAPKPTVPIHGRQRAPVHGRLSRRRIVAFVSGALVLGAVGVLATMWSSADDASLGLAKAPEPLLNLSESPEGPQNGQGDGWAPDKVFPGAPSHGEDKGRTAKPGVALARVPTGNPVPKSPRERKPPLAEQTDKAAASVAAPETTVVASVSEPARAVQATPAPAADDSSPAKADAASLKGDIRAYQPVLVDLLHMLETGQIERLQRWAARSTQQEASAERFAGAYQRLLGDAVVTGLGPARFDLKQVQDRQVVSGAVQIRMLDRNQQVMVRDFRLKAQFVSRSGGPQLASLDAE